jgi:hypothetical protein
LTNDLEALSQGNSIITDNRGNFQLQNLKLPLTVRVEAPGYELWETTVEAPAPLVDSRPLDLEIKLIPQLTAGFLYDSVSGQALSGVEIRISSADQPQSTVTGSNGKFELYGLMPGELISVQAPEGYLPLVLAYSGEPELHLALAPRQVSVTVRDRFTAKPVSQGRLAFSQALTAATSDAGEVTFLAIPDSGEISVSAPGYITRSVNYEGAESLDISLTPATIQGIVRDVNTGQPLPLAEIYLGDTVIQADEKGRFLLEPGPVTPTRLMIKAAGFHRSYARLDQTGIYTDYVAAFSGAEGRRLTTAPCEPAGEMDSLPCLSLSLEPFQARAIYVPLHYLRSRERMLEYLDFIAATELNAIVVDVKGDFGFIAWDSEVDLVGEVGADEWFTDTWLPLDEFVAEAKARDIYTIARMVIFKDNPLAKGKPEWAAVRSDGTVWLDREELGWVNPFREEVWEYNIALAREVAAFGFDELNLDYIRFPSDGDVGAIVYQEENSLESRTTAIRHFMTRFSEALKPYGVFISADVFGLTIWVRPDSDMRIGQRIIDVAPQIDYLAPMVYPSTFISGNLGYDDPAAEPYGVVFRSQQEAETVVPPNVKVRPWLQGYWYTLDEMLLLKQAADDAESAGWAWWNAGGKYDPDLFEPAGDARDSE